MEREISVNMLIDTRSCSSCYPWFRCRRSIPSAALSTQGSLGAWCPPALQESRSCCQVCISTAHMVQDYPDHGSKGCFHWNLPSHTKDKVCRDCTVGEDRWHYLSLSRSWSDDGHFSFEINLLTLLPLITQIVLSSLWVTQHVLQQLQKSNIFHSFSFKAAIRRKDHPSSKYSMDL